MYLRDKQSGDLIEVLDIPAMIDPCQTAVEGRFHAGEELQDAARFAKADLEFPSGESLPQCWVDPDYRAAASR
ncbi:MAG: acetyltransferase [Gammaproteobacteria bacterium]|jgi:hypothetical protein